MTLVLEDVAVEDLPLFGMQTNLGVYLDNGDFGVVFDLGSGLVAKTPRYKKTLPVLLDEAKFGRVMHDGGISCPQYYGVFNVCVRDNSSTVLTVPALVMDKVTGVNPGSFGDNDWDLAYDQINSESEKIRKLGFITLDHSLYRNSIWVPEIRRLYLFDFGCLERAEDFGRPN